MPRVRRFERAFYTTKARWLKLTSCRESRALCGQSWPTQNATAAVAGSGGSDRNVARLDCCNAQLLRQCDRVCSVSAGGVHEAARLYRGTRRRYCRVGTRGARRNLEQASPYCSSQCNHEKRKFAARCFPTGLEGTRLCRGPALSILPTALPRGIWT